MHVTQTSRLVKHYAFIDYATQGYMAFVALLILAFHGDSVPFWPWLLAAHAAGMALVHWLIRTQARHPANRVLDFLRHFYPVILYVGFYRETGELNHMFIPEYLDPIFIRLDEKIFGNQPSLTFMQSLPYWPVSEIFYVSYFSYYIMIVGVGLALFPSESNPKAVKRGEPDGVCRLGADHRCDPFAHLAGSLVGEGHSQDRAGVHPFFE